MTLAEAGVVRLRDVGSTNDAAMARLHRGEGPLWLTAERQTAGRGRRGRPWVSPVGNLYASLAFLTELQADRFSMLPLAAAVALSDALVSLGLSPQHKWPNDVLIDGRKCAGILLEAEHSGDPAGVRRCVIGFGVNISSQPPDAAAATCLRNHLDGIEAEAVFQALRLSLAEAIAGLGAEDGPRHLSKRWLARAIGLGGPVTVRYDRDTIEGRFLGLDPAGRLILGEEGGGTRLIAAGDVFVTRESS